MYSIKEVMLLIKQIIIITTNIITVLEYYYLFLLLEINPKRVILNPIITAVYLLTFL